MFPYEKSCAFKVRGSGEPLSFGQRLHRFETAFEYYGDLFFGAHHYTFEQLADDLVVVFHRAVLYAVEYCVIAHRFCCPCALLYIARKGMYARESLVGFPLHGKSPARRRPLLRSKSAAPKRKTPLRVSFFLERATRLAGGPAGPPHAHGHQNMPPACFSRCARALSSLCPT